MTEDRRGDARYVAALRVDYDDAKDLVADYTENLSVGGARVATTKKFDIGTNVRLALTFPGLATPIRVDGIVRWYREDTIGIEFSAEGRASLSSVIERIRAGDPALVRTAINVLLVEDNTHIAELMRQGLGSNRIVLAPGLAFHTRVASDGREALELLRSKQFDLLIADIYLPVLDGATLIATVRRELGQGLPIIAVSGGGDAARRVALQAGANLFMDKPMRLRELLEQMRTVMKLEEVR